MAHDSSRPAPDPRTTLHDEALDSRVARYRAEQKDDRSTLAAHGDRLDALEELVGRPPSALPGSTGSGLSQNVVDLTVAVRDLKKTIEDDQKARAGEVEALAKRREPYGRVGWLIVAGVVGALSSGVGQALLRAMGVLH